MGDYAKSLGARLRSIRQQQGLSLQGVEEKSAGRWKAVVVGSYERGDRAVTVSRDWPNWPSSTGCRWPNCCPRAAEWVRVTSRRARSSSTWRSCTTYTPAKTCSTLGGRSGRSSSQRGDYNGRVLSIRADDLRALAIVYDESTGRRWSTG